MTLDAMRSEMKFWYEVEDDDDEHVEPHVGGEVLHSADEVDGPLTTNVIRYADGGKQSADEGREDDVIHVDVASYD